LLHDSAHAHETPVSLHLRSPCLLPPHHPSSAEFPIRFAIADFILFFLLFIFCSSLAPVFYFIPFLLLRFFVHAMIRLHPLPGVDFTICFVLCFCYFYILFCCFLLALVLILHFVLLL
jgi:hypothetical protein